jgi:DNA-binding response OmpR family regulator
MDASVSSHTGRSPAPQPIIRHSSDHAGESAEMESRRTILLIEDDLAVRESLRHVLEAEGWRILAVETGEAALDMLQKQAPDLMITDLCLKAVSGWDLLFHENLERPDLPIFVITGLPFHAMNGAAKFAAECFQKPLDLDLLLTAVRSHLGRPDSGAAPPLETR